MWYVVQTMSGEEQDCLQVCKNKVDASVYKEMFVPMYINKKHFRKQWHDIAKPLFPGYFFIDTDDIEPVLEELGKVQRFTKVLRNADAVSPVTPEEQEFLQSMMDENHTILCSVGFIVGEKICVTEGPLRNHYGLIKKINRHRRVAILEIDFFGRKTPAEVGMEVLARLTEEEFQELKQKKMAIYEEDQSHIEEQEKQKESKVKILSGVFEGMIGTFRSANAEKDEWHVMVDLFDTPTEVVFSKEEIRFCD